MNRRIGSYITYTSKSIIIFTLCFILGVIIDEQFRKLQSKYSKSNKLIMGILQLLTIISVMFILNELEFYDIFLEYYYPRTLMSTFLFNLQVTMINNFKLSLGGVI